jgi:hypothetical protein
LIDNFHIGDYQRVLDEMVVGLGAPYGGFYHWIAR